MKEWYWVSCASKVDYAQGGTFIQTKVYPSKTTDRGHAVDFDMIMPTVYVVDDVKNIRPYINFEEAISRP